MTSDAASEPNDLSQAYAALLAGRRARAGEHDPIIDRLAAAGPDGGVLRLSERQPEHELSAGAYVARLVTPERISEGRSELRRHAALLAQIATEYGVPAEILVAIWGVESSFGSRQGEHDVPRALATLAAADAGRRGAFWRGEFDAALAIVAAGDVSAEAMRGSWAGAMGHTQFMPTTFLAHAVDHDRDGRRDIWGSVADALASAASYLKHAGWRRGLSWGCEIELADATLCIRADVAPMTADAWLRAGVRPIGELFAEAGTQWWLKLPEGLPGPALLVSENFAAVLTYNRALPYAFAVCHLADRLAGAPALQHPWRPAAEHLHRTERVLVQRALAAMGWDTGGIDGILGAKSRAAVRAVQQQLGRPADGFADRELMAALRVMLGRSFPDDVCDGRTDGSDHGT